MVAGWSGTFGKGFLLPGVLQDKSFSTHECIISSHLPVEGGG